MQIRSEGFAQSC